jgi:predicted AlkP superfamily phosphohydrolase/phosphomutase
MKARIPILMLGLDAAELTLIQRFMDEGKIPALARLRRQGCFGSLESPAVAYAGAVWPSFYTGRDVPWHGIFHNKLWRPDAMRCEVPDDRWLASRPFWEDLGERGHRLCIVDVPMLLGEPRPINGVYLGGWGTHDLIAKGSWPATLWRELKRRHGPPVMPVEHFGPQDATALVRLTDSLLAATQQMQRIACDLLERERWDFACVVFGATHRVGHYLWDLSQLDENTLSAEQRKRLSAALVDIYRAVDGAIAAVLEQIEPDTLVIAFAVHGMGPNPGWSDLAPDILDAALRSAEREPKKGLLYSLRRRLPFAWVRPVLKRLPMAVTDRLVSLWSSGMYDWKTTRQFPVPMDHAGYVRVNLRGRERDGIVAAGDDYDAVCATIERLFVGLRDRDTLRPIAPRVERAYALAPETATHRDLLPDLIVPWDGPRATDTRELYCDGLPAFRFEVPRRLPSGRSGNHTGRGWFIAAGPGVEPGLQVDGHDILDLAPSVVSLLGAEATAVFPGRPISFDARNCA